MGPGRVVPENWVPSCRKGAPIMGSGPFLLWETGCLPLLSRQWTVRGPGKLPAHPLCLHVALRKVNGGPTGVLTLR